MAGETNLLKSLVRDNLFMAIFQTVALGFCVISSWVSYFKYGRFGP